MGSTSKGTYSDIIQFIKVLEQLSNTVCSIRSANSLDKSEFAENVAKIKDFVNGTSVNSRNSVSLPKVIQSDIHLVEKNENSLHTSVLEKLEKLEHFMTTVDTRFAELESKINVNTLTTTTKPSYSSVAAVG